MGEHHKYSPSKYNAWAECCCYDSSDKQSDEANAGTLIHEQLSKGLLNPEYEPDESTARWGVAVVKELAKGNMLLSEVRLTGVGDFDGIFGTADVLWIDGDTLHIADMKSFSDGTTNYLPQLKGYAALNEPTSEKVVLHILHGGIRQVETVETTMTECCRDTKALLDMVKSGTQKPCLCKWCQYCKNIGSCMETNNALEVVKENGVQFGKLSICQKLVVCDAVAKLCDTIKEEAKALAEASPDKAIEMDGIRYELKPWRGKPTVHDICQLASDLQSPVIRKMNDKTQTCQEIPFDGIDQEELLKLCELSKSGLVDAIRNKNATNKSVKKVDIERWVSARFDSQQGKPHFVRVK